MTDRGTLILSIALALLGWSALGSFTYHNAPGVVNRLIALAILWPTLLVTLLLPTYLVNVRLNIDDQVVLSAARQSALAALFLVLCVWLRMIHVLNWANAGLMLGLFVLTEVLLSARGD